MRLRFLKLVPRNIEKGRPRQVNQLNLIVMLYEILIAVCQVSPWEIDIYIKTAEADYETTA